MNYPFQTNSPYIQAAMAQAVQALMSGGPLPPNCVIMAMPFQQAQQMLPQLMMASAAGGADAMMYQQQTPHYGPQYANNPQARAPAPYPPNYNYPVVLHKNNNHKSKKKTHPQVTHSNVYNSSSFDSYMDELSWSRLFDHHPRKNSKQQNQDPGTSNADQKSNSSEKKQSDSSSSSSSSSTTSDETIRRVNVSHKQPSNNSSKQQTKGSLPFKYSSEFIPGTGKQQSQKIKSNDVFIVKKP